MHRLIFIDASAWIAAFVKRDECHAAAAQAMESLLGQGVSFLTTDYIFDETVTRIRHEGGHHAAVHVGEQILASRVARLVDVGPELRDEAWRIFKKYREQEFSFTDCTSFAAMKRFGISRAFTFDDDFLKAGFDSVPRRSNK